MRRCTGSTHEPRRHVGGAPRGRAGRSHRGRFWLLTEILPFAAGILIWQALSSLNVWPRVLFPSPLEVAQAFVQDIASGVLLVNLGVSLQSLAARICSWVRPLRFRSAT